MPTRSRRIERRNPKRPPVKKDNGQCGVCGFEAPAYTLVRQRGKVVSTLHSGCLDDPVTYKNRVIYPSGTAPFSV